MKTYFIDFEASSLDPDSYPIEIAWVDETGQGECYLIRPMESWTNWSAQSEAFHHISREMLLNQGIAVDRVARRAWTVLHDRLGISDNPAFDARWLSMLFRVIGCPRVHLHSLPFLISGQLPRLLTLIEAIPDSAEYHRQARLLLDEGQALIANITESAWMQTRHRHRALPDATELWSVWKAVRDAIDQRVRLAKVLPSAGETVPRQRRRKN